jgi:hypothetical protein
MTDAERVRELEAEVERLKKELTEANGFIDDIRLCGGELFDALREQWQAPMEMDAMTLYMTSFIALFVQEWEKDPPKNGFVTRAVFPRIGKLELDVHRVEGQSAAEAIGDMKRRAEAAEAEAGRLREAAQAFLQAALMPRFGEYSGYESATYTYEKSYGGGECSRHGRYYGSCASCRYDFERFKERADWEARNARDKAIEEAADKTRAALSAPAEPKETK